MLHWLRLMSSGIWLKRYTSPESNSFLSMISTFTSLPFFLFTLPAGALADIMDRGRLATIMYIWLAAAAGGLAVLGWLNLLNGYLILLFIFLIGTGSPSTRRHFAP
jgi:MFS family permease